MAAKPKAKRKPSPKKGKGTTAPKQEGAGRPTDYRADYAGQAEHLCKLGATERELAEFFGVDTVTIYRWKLTHPKFCNAVKAGKELADERVVRSLYNRAVGYTYESEKVFQFQGAVVRAPVLEHVPPDVGAAFNWLKNRRPEEWRDRKELTGANGGPIQTLDLTRLTDEQFAVLEAAFGDADEGRHPSGEEAADN